MELTKHKIGEFVEPISIKCGIAKCPKVAGININKRFMPSRNIGESTSKYLVVPPDCFAFNLMHVGRDEKIPVALNTSDKDIVVSPAYFVFRVIDEDIILRRYFYILMSSPEFDRYAWFCTDSSIRGNLEWSRFCEIQLDLPSTGVQRQYADVITATRSNLSALERGIDNMYRACDAFIERMISECPKEAIGPYIEQTEERNYDLAISLDDVRGIATQKSFIETKANMDGIPLNNYKIVRPDCFAYVADTSRRGDKMSLAYNNDGESYLVSSITTIFRIKPTQTNALLSDYLFMYFRRPEFDRYARFNSWGSAREVISWEDLCRLEIQIPNIEIQQDIVNIFNTGNVRRQLAKRLSDLQKSICPILIKGSLGETQRKQGDGDVG